MSVSVLILTLNEELNLPDCLESVSWSDDIVVFDSFSSDRTVEIAKTAGARVVQRKFDNWSAHQNWAVENIESATSLIPIDEAIEAVSGNQDWSDPTVLQNVIEMMAKVRDPWAYFYRLPSEVKEAVIDFVTNSSQADVRTTTVEVSFGYNDGVLHYTNSGTGLDVVIDTGEVNNEDSRVKLGTTESIDLWLNTILAPDPQAYFDALPAETQQAMAIALSDKSIFETVLYALR